jgi:septal ring factor EnvC (AmiA/AmiB activator)
MVNALVKILISFLFFSVISFGQIKEKISSKNNELESLRLKINSLESELSKLTTKERSNLKVLKKIDRQKLLLSKSIKTLEKEEKIKEEKIKELTSKIKKLQKRVKKLQKRYSEYIIWLYKQGETSTLKYLINSESFHQALLRYKYLGHVHSANKKVVDELKTLKEKLSLTINDLSEEVKEKEKIISTKAKEKSILEHKRTVKKKILTKLKKNKKSVVKEISEKRKAEIRIKRMIADLIEKERKMELKRREKKLKGEIEEYVPRFNYNSFENFAELKGKLNWPVKKSKIERGFGENKNKKTKTVTLNYGVDLKTTSNTDVYAVAEGVVSAIEWIAGYGSVMIITHRNNYRTVYGHLTDINVLEGNKVSAGDVIGKVNSSLEGNILHFEIWNERNYKNPEEWLARK